MQHGQPQPGQRPGGQLLEDLLDRAQRRGRGGTLDGVAVLVEVELVGLALLRLVGGDAGAHDVDLVAALDLLAHPRPDAGDPARTVHQRHDVGLDRRPAGGQLGQRRRLEVAEDGHRDGPRDRRRGHHQHVRRDRGLAGQRRPLLDPEPVLLVDHDQAEVREADPVLEQRVGADHDAGLAAGHPAQRGGALGLGHRAREQLDGRALVGPAEHAARREVAEHRDDRAVVLLGEHLGRGEQRRLAAGVDDAEHRAQGDQRLAGADLALQQPVHRVRLGEVGLDLRADLALPAGSSKGSRASNAASRPPPPARGRAPSARTAARRRASTSWVTSASSKRKRWWARSTWSGSSGAWTQSSACRAPRTSYSSRTGSGRARAGRRAP